jgi:DNA repair protein RadC
MTSPKKISVLQLKEEFLEYDTRPIMSAPEKVYALLKPLFLLDREVFFLLSLNTKNGVKAIRTISIGSLNANVVHPREVFRAAILDSASHIIVSHNHPSGDPTPSKEDIEITKKLVEASNILGITLLDHVIIGEGRHYSLKETGHI